MAESHVVFPTRGAHCRAGVTAIKFLNFPVAVAPLLSGLMIVGGSLIEGGAGLFNMV